ncbi:ABC transporter ATP-binding protein [Labrys okinawensis]|uniref:ABC transporter ATP-binding protein n=1 Tax=Labrys okinawensis TaxID=346911 RepID=UPI0039BCC0FB
MSVVVEGRNLHKFYRIGDDEVFALRDVSLDLGQGEIVALIGASGSGKSTLLACIAGLEEPDGGYVKVAGSRISHRTEAARSQLRRRHVGILMQSGTLFDHLTVFQNIRLQQHLAGTGEDEQVHQLLEKLGLARQGDKLPIQLSGGEVARGGLAVALAGAHTVLLCDEPTAELDSKTEAAILSLIRERCDEGTAALVATHSEAVARMANRAIHLKDGRVVDA